MSQKVLRRLVWGVFTGLALAFFAEAGTILVGRNFHTLIPGRAYRCAQPSPADLQRYIAKYGIKTVINLRGCCSTTEWYIDEGRATAAANIAQEDITFSAGRLPAPQELRRLIEVLDRAAYPILIHCRRGVDRTGLTSVIVKMLDANASLNVARKELGLCHAHIRFGRTEAMLRFFDLYETWLKETGREHAPSAFREFVAAGYVPGPAKARIELVEMPPLHAGQPAAIHLRALNESVETWHLRPGTGSGVHLKFTISDPSGAPVQQGFAGLFRKEIPRGQSVDLTLALSGLPPGRYTLIADLHEVPDVSFAQLGSEPLVQEIAVP
jgi:protein tyrosine/serine phosphatase